MSEFEALVNTLAGEAPLVPNTAAIAQLQTDLLTTRTMELATK